MRSATPEVPQRCQWSTATRPQPPPEAHSALAKRYLREKGSSLKVRRLLASALPVTSRYSAVEIASALARRAREGAISAEDGERADEPVALVAFDDRLVAAARKHRVPVK